MSIIEQQLQWMQENSCIHVLDSLQGLYIQIVNNAARMNSNSLPQQIPNLFGVGAVH